MAPTSSGFPEDRRRRRVWGWTATPPLSVCHPQPSRRRGASTPRRRGRTAFRKTLLNRGRLRCAACIAVARTSVAGGEPTPHIDKTRMRAFPIFNPESCGRASHTPVACSCRPVQSHSYAASAWQFHYKQKKTEWKRSEIEAGGRMTPWSRAGGAQAERERLALVCSEQRTWCAGLHSKDRLICCNSPEWRQFLNTSFRGRLLVPELICRLEHVYR